MDNSPIATINEARSLLSSLSPPIVNSGSTSAKQPTSPNHFETATQNENTHVTPTLVPEKPNKHSDLQQAARVERRPTPPITRQPRSSSVARTLADGNNFDQRRTRAASVSLAALSMDPIRSNQTQGESFDCEESCCLIRCLRRRLHLKLFTFGVACLLIAAACATVLDSEGLALGVLSFGIIAWLLLCGLSTCQCCDLILRTLMLKALRAADERRRKQEELEKEEKEEKEEGRVDNQELMKKV